MTQKELIEYLEAENKWLWYNHLNTDPYAEFIEVTQYNKLGEAIQKNAIHLPPKKYRVKHPNEFMEITMNDVAKMRRKIQRNKSKKDRK